MSLRAEVSEWVVAQAAGCGGGKARGEPRRSQWSILPTRTAPGTIPVWCHRGYPHRVLDGAESCGSATSPAAVAAPASLGHFHPQESGERESGQGWGKVSLGQARAELDEVCHCRGSRPPFPLSPIHILLPFWFEATPCHCLGVTPSSVLRELYGMLGIEP